jgi:hypothetical protein
MACRLPPPKHGGARVDVVFDMAAGTDPDFVPRDVRVPEHDYVADWEPPPESSVPADSWTAVVDHGHRTHPAMSTNRCCSRSRPWSLLSFTAKTSGTRAASAIQQSRVGHLAGVQDHVATASSARSCRTAGRLAEREVRVGAQYTVVVPPTVGGICR